MKASDPGPWERYGWLLAVVWLVFLFYPIQALVASDAAPGWRIVAWTGLVSFAITYVWGFVAGMRAGWRQPSRLVAVLYLAAIGSALLTVPAIAWDTLGFAPFLMAYASYGFTWRAHWIANIAGIALLGTAVLVALAQQAPPPWPLFIIVVMLAGANTINTWLIDRSVAAEDLRMDLATSEERETIARDVHDLLGHSLTVVKLKAELAARLIERDPDAARAELADISRLTGEAIAGVRSTVTGLRSAGLDEELRISRAALESAGIEVTVTGSADALSPAQSLPAGWILREATTNVLRHAQAESVRIEIAPGTLNVWDDGAGIRAEPGNGLRGMAERAAGAGAVLAIEPGADAGTRVSLTW